MGVTLVRVLVMENANWVVLQVASINAFSTVAMDAAVVVQARVRILVQGLQMQFTIAEIVIRHAKTIVKQGARNPVRMAAKQSVSQHARGLVLLDARDRAKALALTLA